jgi:uncharacterized SAM-binding protein YcdF (DUF218 family)
MKYLFSKKSVYFIKYFLLVFGILILIYFTITSISWGRMDLFNLLISFLGILLIFVSFKIKNIIVFFNKLPKIIQYLIKIIFVCFIISFMFFQIKIIYHMHSKPKNGADYIIILGCQVMGEYASLPLLQRGFTAIRYLNRNPETKVIVSGGQGPGENITEAEALRRLLLENKIDRNRILLEDKSRNTMQNLNFSNELYDLLDKNIIIVTSDYHMFRALSVARKLNYTNVSGLPSRSQRSVLPAFLIREYVSIMYNKMLRRM